MNTVIQTTVERVRRGIVVSVVALGFACLVGCSGGGSTSGPTKSGDGGTAPPPKPMRTPNP